jgi:hypothetical protein
MTNVPKLANAVLDQYRDTDPVLVASMHLGAALSVLYGIDEDLTDELVYLHTRVSKSTPLTTEGSLSKHVFAPRCHEIYDLLRKKLSP